MISNCCPNNKMTTQRKRYHTKDKYKKKRRTTVNCFFFIEFFLYLQYLLIRCTNPLYQVLTNLFGNSKMVSLLEFRNLWRRLERREAGFLRFGNFSRNRDFKWEFKLINHETRKIRKMNCVVKCVFCLFLFFCVLLALSWKTVLIKFLSLNMH